MKFGRVLASSMLVTAMACTDGSSNRDPSPSPAATPPETDPAPPPTTSDPSLIPEDWIWITDTRGRFEIVMPALPRSMWVSHADTTRVLRAERDGSEYTITSAPDRPDALQRFEAKVATRGTVSDRARWRDHGVGLTIRDPSGTVRVRAAVLEDRLYTLEVSGPASDTDAERFFSSLDPRTTPQDGVLHDAKRGYRVQAPARMGRWRDLQGVPPLFGHRGVFDGHQFGVNVNELFLVSSPKAAVEGAIIQIRKELRAELVELDPRPHDGRPSRRIEIRAPDGMYATIRVLLDGTRLFQASVFAPSGIEAPWADAYVDSLSIQH